MFGRAALVSAAPPPKTIPASTNTLAIHPQMHSHPPIEFILRLLIR
jgi:hypothetical protein